MVKWIVNKKVSKYLSDIGKVGGSKRKDHPDRKALAKKAALKRWAKEHPQPLSISHATDLASYPNESPSIKEPI